MLPQGVCVGQGDRGMHRRLAQSLLLRTPEVTAVCCAQSLYRVRVFATPWTVAHQALLSMGFSRQEYWSELPCCSPRDLPNPGIKPRSPALQADSLPSEPLGKPKNTGVGSLSLLQQIFPTQELNLGLLHCRWILYQLSYHPKLKLATAGGPPWGQPPATALFS